MRHILHALRGPSTTSLVAATIASLALMLAASAAGAAGPSPEPSPAQLPAPYGPAQNGHILFSRDGDIYVADASGEQATALINGQGTDAWPIWSREGSRFMFERDSPLSPRLLLARPDGSLLARVGEVPGEFPWSDWSPDVQHFAAEWEVEGLRVLQILTTDQTEAPATLDLQGIEPEDLAGFRPPDGRELIFTGHPKAGSTELGLYAIGIDGTGLRTIGTTAVDGAFQQLALSPDGSTVAYWNWEPGVGLQSNMYARDLTTGTTRALSLDPVWPGVGLGPRFSPDGASLLFESGPHVDDPNLDSQLVYARMDGSAPPVLLGAPYAGGDRESYDLSPDGTTVLLDLAGAAWFLDTSTGRATKSMVYMPDQPSWQRR